MLKELNRPDFLEKLHKVLKPSVPIDSVEHLFGRDKEFDNIEEALYADGRHCFIYGDRGVGKSSLAFSIANHLQSSDKPHIRVNCISSSTFLSVLNQIFHRLEASGLETEVTNVKKAVLSIPGLDVGSEVSKKYTLNPKQTGQQVDYESAAHLLQAAAHNYSDRTVIVIDEFDTIDDLAEKEMFGTLIKALSNIGCRFKLIFTGIAKSLTELLGGHASSVRQIHQEHLDPLDWTGRFKIIDNAFDSFDVAISDDIRFRIAGMSDGYPSYVHLMCEKLLNEIYRGEKTDEIVSFETFIDALDSAIDSIAQDIKKDYMLATEGREEHFHHILWAMADSADNIRQMDHIRFSYASICGVLSIEQLDEKTLKKEFDKLKSKPYGRVIERGIQNRPGWFKFKESMVRGLVRMYAEKHGVALDFERHFTAGKIHVSSKHAYGKYRPLTPVESGVAKLRGDKD